MVTRDMLDYLPTAVRAHEARPDSVILWAEAIRAQRTIITAADLDLAEPGAAKVQELVNVIASLAGETSLAAITRAEDAKTRIIALTSN